jgi:hypothetical protein
LDKHRRDVAERVKHNQNCLKKFEREQEDDFDHEVKHFQQEQTKQYRIKKDTLKRVLNKQFSFFFLYSKKICFFRKY